jgi:hypothetical protein
MKETHYVLIDLDPGLTLRQECTPTKWITGIFCPLYHKIEIAHMQKRLIRNIERAGEPKPTITDLSPVKEKEVDALTLKNKLGTRYNEKQLAAKPKYQPGR